MTLSTNEGACTLTAIHVYPIKSCAGLSLSEALLVETGLAYDRAWMVVDEGGTMLTQREHPRLALVRPAFKANELVLRAPGMLALHLRLDTVEAPTRVQIWDDVVKAYDMGALAAQWFSDYLGTRVRLSRFDPEEQRWSSPAWTAQAKAGNAFSDGFPLLVVGSASLDDLNRRLSACGRAEVSMQRFRPNLVFSGWNAYDEDHVHELAVSTDDGPVQLRLIKPCVRCSIPNVDPDDASTSDEPGATLAAYRSDPRMQGGITFGMNAIVIQGFERTLRVGQAAKIRWSF